jgi:glutathione S-transferase
MITLYTFGPNFGLPDPSPFVVKAEVLLKMAGLPYRTDTTGFKKAPKGKLPYIDDDGTIVGDSTFIRIHLETKHHIDFDEGLSPAERGTAWAFEKMCEDHLYWAMMYARWIDDANFEAGPRKFFHVVPAPLRPFLATMIRRQVRRNLWGQGLGRHSAQEVAQLAERAIGAIAATLGDKPHLMGARACGADATVFAFLLGLLNRTFETPIRSAVEQRSNLVAYCVCMLRQYYREFAETKATAA